MRILHVFCNQKHVGIFSEFDDGGRVAYRFKYDDGVMANQAVSLTMPVSKPEYVFPEVPYAFTQNFPEGERFLALQRLARVARVDDDFGILAIVGQTAIGRIQFSETLLPPSGNIPTVSLHDATAGGKNYFSRLISAVGVTQGVSGAQDKVLFDEMRTVASGRHILKAFDAERFPALAENEYWTTRAAVRCGIETSSVRLSDDRQVLIVDRFDVAGDGSMLGFEESGALRGFKNTQKYMATYESVAESIEDWSSNVLSDNSSFFRQLVFAVKVRNGDAHLKNFGLLSNGKSTRLAPAYDLVSTGAYVNKSAGEFENPALCLDNERFSKAWWGDDVLSDFARDILFLDKKTVTRIFINVQDGLHAAADEMLQADCSPEFEPVRRCMVDDWLSAYTRKPSVAP